MKPSHTLLSLAAILMLAACTNGGSPPSMTLKDHLNNPLFRERYADDFVDRMVELKIQNSPVLEDKDKAEVVEQQRVHWLEESRLARKDQRDGLSGDVIGIDEFAKGRTLVLNNMVYFSTTFETVPGPEVHVILTTAVDPRDVEFPDPSSLDLGILQSPYGEQQYVIPPNDLVFRTVVLWDTKLERLYGFAQLSKPE